MTEPPPKRWFRRKRLFLLTGAVIAVVAITWWSGALAAWPRRQAEEAIRANDLDGAEVHIRRAIRRNPGSADSWFLLARIQRKQGLLDEFARSLDRAASRGLDHRRAEKERLLAKAQSGDVASVQTQLDDMLIRGDADGREVLEAYVNGCLKAARMPQAETLIDGWINEFPDDAQPYYYNGRLLMFYGRNDAAEKQFLAALERVPEHHASAYLLGKILMQENRPQEALERFEQCDSMKYNAAPRIAQARAMRTIGRVDDARRILEQVVQLPAEDVRQSFRRVGDRYEGAPAHLELGGLELAAGRHEKALPWLDAAVRANPHDLAARHALGIALRGAGRAEDGARELKTVREARAALREVDRLADMVQANPALVDERVRIGELYLMYESQLTGEYWLKTALVRDPDHQRAHRLLADYYEERARENPAYDRLARLHRQKAGESLDAAPQEASESA